jgi:16S rRNA processing protein RimM
LPDDEFYAFQLVGASVEDADGRRAGRVADVVPGVANDVLELDSGLSLPLVEDCVREIDVEGGRIVVASGYIEA